jgi:16S rRNA (uracil1498-N3)-methyltransferase
MTRRRWIADEASTDKAALTGAHAEHLIRVLRARIGQEFEIVAAGVVRHGRVTNIADGKVQFELGQEISSSPAPVNVTLLLAVFKFDRMEWAIEKATELGVARIVPVIARRTDAHLASAALKRVGRWRRIVVQAAEQSRRSAPPEFSEPVKLQAAVSLPASLKIVLSEAEEDSSLRDLLNANENASTALLAIGPEGGWTEDELELFGKEGWTSASLGPTIFRAETAAIASVAITTSLLS